MRKQNFLFQGSESNETVERPNGNYLLSKQLGSRCSVMGIRRRTSSVSNYIYKSLK